MPSRRSFLTTTAATFLTRKSLFAQALPPAPTTRPNLALIDHDRILAAATQALTIPPTPTQDLQSPAFTAFTLALPALAAATLVDPTQSPRYNEAATTLLQAWLITPKTRLSPTPAFAAFGAITDLSPIAETALAVPFLPLSPEVLTPVKQWFADYLTFLTTARLALLARDQKDHNGTAWLLQVVAAAKLTANDPILAEARHRFRTPTLRNQLNADGFFLHDLPSPNPYRDSLFNLDLLAGAAQLLSTRFETVWDTELQDGPGLRAAIARHAVYIADRTKWPYPADQTHFKLLPCRRPALAFAGRAYTQPDYITLWRSTTPAQPTEPDLLRTFPIRQPILWLTQPKAAYTG